MYYKNTKYRISYFFIVSFLLITGILCLLPILHILMVSLSGRAAANANLVTFWPIDFTWTNYEKTLANPTFYRSFVISVLRTLIGTVLSMLITVLALIHCPWLKPYFGTGTFIFGFSSLS